MINRMGLEPLTLARATHQKIHSVTRDCFGDRITDTPEVTSHEGSQIPHDCLVSVIRLLQALILLLVISSLPNLVTAWYSALYCPSNHSDINANVKYNQTLSLCCVTFLQAMQLREKMEMVSTKNRRIPSAFYRLGLPYLFLNFPNIKHIAYIYNRSIAYLSGMKINHREKCPPFAI